MHKYIISLLTGAWPSLPAVFQQLPKGILYRELLSSESKGLKDTVRRLLEISAGNEDQAPANHKKAPGYGGWKPHR